MPVFIFFNIYITFDRQCYPLGEFVARFCEFQIFTDFILKNGPGNTFSDLLSGLFYTLSSSPAHITAIGFEFL